MPLGISKEDIKEFDEEFKNKKISHKTKIISKMAADEAITEEDLNKLKKKESQEITNFKDLSDIDKLLYYLAEKTEGYVGADIEAICREAAIYALRKDINAKEVTIKHFEKALKIVRPSATKEVEEMYKTLQNHFREAKAKQMKEERPSYMG
jgi:SpoVK/Ycf46/Vps4 family AAA+-type ATPase